MVYTELSQYDLRLVFISEEIIMKNIKTKFFGLGLSLLSSVVALADTQAPCSTDCMKHCHAQNANCNGT